MSGEDSEVRPVAVAEGSSNGSSGSPSPGDTLPWNLGKTQRSRRSGGGSVGNGSVLDPAERAVIRIAGNGKGSGQLALSAQVLNTFYVLCVPVFDWVRHQGPSFSYEGGLFLNW
jgi:hypothetical protein